jgi:hypothetical protein
MCAKISRDKACDNCGRHAAVYVEKKRRRGRLTRDQVCAGCLQALYGRHGLGPEDFKRL